jgi:hypothetical protein
VRVYIYIYIYKALALRPLRSTELPLPVYPSVSPAHLMERRTFLMGPSW